MKKWLILLMFPFVAAGQDQQNWLETVHERSAEDVHQEAYTDAYSLDPPDVLNLNRALREDLLALGVLNEFQVESILAHRARTGPWLHVNELQAVEGMTLDDVHRLLPWVTLGTGQGYSRISGRGLLSEGHHEGLIQLDRQLEEEVGYRATNGYFGSPERLLLRYRYRFADRVKCGVVLEKDAGESFKRSDGGRGLDFYSAYVSVDQSGPLDRIVLGDYQAQFGQGLSCWSGFAVDRGVGVATSRRVGRGITPYASANEYHFLRGGAVVASSGRFKATVFGSRKRIDARIDSITSRVTSVSTSGLHRTANELERRKNLPEWTLGGALEYKRKNGSIGFIHANRSVRNSLVNPWRQMDVDAAQFSNSALGVFGHVTRRNVHAFGEVARQNGGAKAAIVGLIVSLSQGADASLTFRSYQRNFHPSLHNGFRVGTGEELGVSFRMETKFQRKLTWIGAVDIGQMNGLRYRVSAPSQRLDFMQQLLYKPAKNHHISFRYRIVEDQRNASNQTKLEVLHTMRHQQRLHWEWVLGKHITLRGRVEHHQFKAGIAPAQHGWLMFYDVYLKGVRQTQSSVKLRYALFSVTDYDARIYAYEPDIRYAFSVPAYNGSGSRFVVVYQYKSRRIGVFSIKAAQFFWDHTSAYGSGLSEVSKSTRTQIRLQWRIDL